MKRLKLGDVVRYEGELHVVDYHTAGQTSYHLRAIEKRPCAACGREFGVDLILGSRIAEAGLQPVPTLEES